jgi:hypothetical protein
MPRKKSDKPSSDYPQGKHTVTWKDIDEDDMWLIIHAFRARIEYFQSRLNEINNTNDPDLICSVADWYEGAIEKLTSKLYEFEDQISPTYFKRKR